MDATYSLLSKNQINYLKYKNTYKTYYQNNKNKIIDRQKSYYKNNVFERKHYQRTYEYKKYHSSSYKNLYLQKKLHKENEAYIEKKKKYFNL